MGIVSLTILAAGAAAGFAGAKRLMAPEGLPEQIPEGARARALKARAALLGVRESAAELLRRIEVERSAAERELMDDYLKRTGRSDSSLAVQSRPAAASERGGRN